MIIFLLFSADFRLFYAKINSIRARCFKRSSTVPFVTNWLNFNFLTDRQLRIRIYFSLIDLFSSLIRCIREYSCYGIQ